MNNFLFKSMIFVAFLLFFANCTDDNSNQVSDNNQIDSTQQVVNQKDTLDLSKYDRSYNDIALWLAGISQDTNGTYKNLEQSDAWKDYSSDISEAFQMFEKSRVVKLDSFRDAYLVDANRDIKTLFYPYSGPDFMNANILFPNADTIIMAALEPIGTIPDFSGFSEYKKSSYFSQVVKSMKNILSQGYFVTKKMKVEYKSEVVDSIDGVLPILFIFLAQSDCYILDVENFTIDKQGNPSDSVPANVNLSDPNDTYITGLKINYVRTGEDKIKTIIYFSHNIGEPEINATPEFITYLNKRSINVTFLKAASYLNIWFEKIRDVTLNKSEYILQDDSGVPIKYFNTDEWNIQLFGTYTRTLAMFTEFFQPKLRDLYKQDANIIPLNFATGYNGNFEESNLQLITKKK